jgi:AraC family transcriptional regulator of adaptative response / DNA-3-methyladenine glycosylase II
LAHRLAVSERHLHRLLVAEVGASPLALARTRRAQTARLLVESTDLPITDIAFTAGYSSVRQFNDSVREAFGCTPSELRTRSTKRIASSGAITLRLALHPPYDGDSWLAWLKSRAVASIEDISDTTYRRTIRLPRTTGIIELTPAADHMAMRLCIDSLADLAVAVSRCRVLGDLDADPETVAAVLTQDSFLAPAVEKLPGLRVPGHMDGFELACRAVIGQQISVAGARAMLGRLVEALGEPLSTPDGTLNRLFPTASAVAGSTLDGLGLTGARRRTLTALAGAVAGGSLDLNRGADRSETVQKLLELPGIGPWTASYIAIRALGDPDAFPASDLGLLRTSRELGGPESAVALEEYSLRWRPWRAYAAQYLWSI